MSGSPILHCRLSLIRAVLLVYRCSSSSHGDRGEQTVTSAYVHASGRENPTLAIRQSLKAATCREVVIDRNSYLVPDNEVFENNKM